MWPAQFMIDDENDEVSVSVITIFQVKLCYSLLFVCFLNVSHLFMCLGCWKEEEYIDEDTILK